MLLSSAISAFTTAKTTKLQPASKVWYGYQFSALERWLSENGHGDTLPVEPETIDAFLAHEKEVLKLKPSSVHGRWRALKVLYKWLVNRGKLPPDQNPMLHIDEPANPATEPRHAVLDEFLALLDSIPMVTWMDSRDRLTVTTFFLAGLRISELVNLRIQDFDVTKRVIRIRTQKGGDANVVPMLQAVCDAFIEYIYNRPEYPNEHVFLASNGAGGITGVITRNGMYQRIQKLCARAGIPPINPHAFRHGLAMYLLNTAGANTALIQRMLRHKDERTTRQIYARWDITGVSSQYDEKMIEVDNILKNRKPGTKS